MIPLLQRLNGSDADMLLNSCDLHEVEKGELIFEEGYPADHLYFIQQGQVRVFKEMQAGKEITIFLRKNMDCFGEIGIFSGRHYSNSAQTTENSIIYNIHKEKLEEILTGSGHLTLNFTRWIADSLEASKAKIRDYLAFGSEGAVASVFIRYANMYGIVTTEGIEINEPIVLQDIGRHIGISRETVSRIVNKWKEKNILENKNKEFLIKDIAYFRKLLICEDCAVENCIL